MLSHVPIQDPSFPSLPQPLQPLIPLAMNLWWAWNPTAHSVFAELDPQAAKQKVSPVGLLQAGRRREALAGDGEFLERVTEVVREFEKYLATPPKSPLEGLVAYFCAEFGLHESFPIYSGGLGILAGDHAKEASDQGLPFIGVGLLYRGGFFQQVIDAQGRQEHVPPVLEPDRLPIGRVAKDGEPLTISVEFPGRTIFAAVWRVAVGRVPLLLLDTDLPENAPEDRLITSKLYVSGRDMRLHQEIVLGVGGVRALRALGIEPTVWHLNEGHSAFLLLERWKESLSSGQVLEDAANAVKSQSILTIHTPVAAGNERFDTKLVKPWLTNFLEGTPLSPTEVLKTGRDSEGDKQTFDLTAFALRLSRMQNGVSLLHGKTADATWRKVAGQPVIGLTNGVHLASWLGPEMTQLYEASGAQIRPATKIEVKAKMGNRPTWEGIENVSDEELWAAHQAQKLALITFARERLALQHARHGEGPGELRSWLDALSEDALILGFARRFATYKRATLLFSDRKRLAKLLGDSERPVRIVFAGKAHPADGAGQEFISAVYRQTMGTLRGKVFLLEDYDMEAGRQLVQGVDVWLNNPRRPLEASGTSGMKAAANGVPNLSILDGWWDEGYEKGNGWAIGGREALKSAKAQDKADAQALYETLENEVVPLYFGNRAGWLNTMRRAIATSAWAFSTARMLEDYEAQMYA